MGNEKVKVVKVREITEKPVYYGSEIDRLAKLLHAETNNIDWSYVQTIANDVGIAPEDLCRILGISGEQKLMLIKTGKMRMPYEDRLVLYLFDALFEYKPNLKSVLFGRVRSYWTGYAEAGGKLPRDMKKFMDLTDPVPLDWRQYRQGVKDCTKEREKDGNANAD